MEHAWRGLGTHKTFTGKSEVNGHFGDKCVDVWTIIRWILEKRNESI
jgi:hypothetical protein